MHGVDIDTSHFNGRSFPSIRDYNTVMGQCSGNEAPAASVEALFSDDSEPSTNDARV